MKHGKPFFGRVAWLLALAVLAGALICFNLPGTTNASTADTAKPEEDDGILFGYEVGQRVPDFTLPTVYAGDWKLSDMRGRAVVLNLWATWCTPCVNELPFFQNVYDAYGEDIAMLAIHSDLITDDVKEYLDKKSYTLPFAVDESGEIIESLGGSTMLPQTVILNARGVVTYNQAGSMNEEKLTALVEQALKSK